MYDSRNCNLYEEIIPANTSKIVRVPINFHDGEVFIPEQLISSCVIGDCVTTVKKNRGIIEVYNPTRHDVIFSMDRPVSTGRLANYADVFYLEGEPFTFTNQIKHSIRTTDEIPVYTKSYRYPYVHRQEVQNQISKMLQQGIIHPSQSAWNSPIWVVPKKVDASGKNKWRLVVDFRKLNDKTIDDKYPIPNIADVLDKLGNCHYFTTLDLASGFYQVEMNPEDIPKTGFNVEPSTFQFE